MSLVDVVCCQVEVYAPCRSLVQRGPTEGVCVSECDHMKYLSAPTMSRYREDRLRKRKNIVNIPIQISGP